MTDDIARLDATAQAALVRRGEVSPAELVEAAIVRIDKLNPQLNAVITPLYDKAVAAARAADLPDGPFRGVPMLIKDAVAHTAGDAYHFGMRALRDAGHVAERDTWLVERFRAAGFLIAGKTNVPELAATVTTEPLAYGATHNPWDTTRSPGGSSGGAAAAVASGMVAVAHGNDMGGSIRFPASSCGLVGLKPSRARTSLGPDRSEIWGPLTHEHVLTRSVRDSAAVLDVTRGAGCGDPYTAPPATRPYASEVGADPGRLRIGLRTERGGGQGPSHPDCVAAVDVAARLLAGLGHEVNPADVSGLDDPRMVESTPATLSAWVAHEVALLGTAIGRDIDSSELEPMNALLVDMGKAVTAQQYLTALDAIQAWSRGVVAWWEAGNDILVTPTSPEPPRPLGTLSPLAKEPFELLMDLSGIVTFTSPFNSTGQPAISLPLHWNAQGLPIGVQLVAAPGREDMLIRLAAQLEAAQPWSGRWPAVS